MPALHLDHVILAARDLGDACAPFERLGLVLSPPSRNQTGNENRALFTPAASGEFYVEVLAVWDRARASARPSWRAQERAMTAGPALFRVVLATDDIGEAAAAAASLGIPGSVEEALREDGTKVCDLLNADLARLLGCDVAILAYPETPAARAARHHAAGLFAHGFPLKRLDHLAAIVPEPGPALRAWAALGVPLYGEVRGRGMQIFQLRLGDAILELIAPETAASPVASRPPGLIGMAAYEVPDLAQAVALARDRGFTLPDPAEGVLPGTRTTTISPDQLSGLALQLLEYSGPR
jgi:hypothetical protein